MEWDRFLLITVVAYHTLLGAGSFGLELSRGYTELMDVVAGGTGNAFIGM